jgi:hypothetical protein
MKRLTIDGDWRRVGNTWDLFEGLGSPVLSVPVMYAVVEDVPLPSEPGARFWGKTTNTEPQWWFVREGIGDIWYVPSSARPASLCASEIPPNGLVRLPAPTEEDHQ